MIIKGLCGYGGGCDNSPSEPEMIPRQRGSSRGLDTSLLRACLRPSCHLLAPGFCICGSMRHLFSWFCCFCCFPSRKVAVLTCLCAVVPLPLSSCCDRLAVCSIFIAALGLHAARTRLASRLCLQVLRLRLSTQRTRRLKINRSTNNSLGSNRTESAWPLA